MSASPWLKFYPSDWRSDPALRMCSLPARGLWMEMLCLMHEATERGSLLVNGNPVSDKQLAALAGVSLRETVSCLAELEAAGVFSRDNGIIYSRRMRRDTERAERDKANGKGGGNPSLKGGVNPPDNGGDKAQKLDTRSQRSDRASHEKRASGPDLIASEFDDVFWPGWPNKVGKPKALEKFRVARKTASLDEIMAGVERYVRDKPPERQWLNPATFLYQSRFHDQPAPVETRHANGAAKPTLGDILRAAEAEIHRSENDDDQPYALLTH